VHLPDHRQAADHDRGRHRHRRGDERRRADRQPLGARRGAFYAIAGSPPRDPTLIRSGFMKGEPAAVALDA